MNCSLAFPDSDVERAWNAARQTLFCPEWAPDLEAPVPEIGLCLDKGYDYGEVREVAAELGYTTPHPLSRRRKTSQTGRRKGAAVGG